MSDGSFQAALAALLVSRDERTLLLREPDRLRERFDLSADEVRLLAAASHARIELSAWTVASKRLEFLGRALPTALAMLGARCHDPRLMEFVERCPPLDVTEDGNRIVAEGRRFLDYLERELPPWAPEHVRDVARFELMRQTLVFSTDASVAAAQGARQQDERRRGGVPTGRFVLGVHVAVDRFDCDVVAAVHELRTTGAVAPVPGRTAVALRKTPAGPVLPYRLGEATYELLAGWRTPRPMPDAADPTGGRALAAATFALDEGFLVAEHAEG